MRLGPRKAADLLVDGFDAFEREVVYAALERAGGNKTHAARLLGITRRQNICSREGGRAGRPARLTR